MDEVPKIEGFALSRLNGEWLGLKADIAGWTLSFYDGKKRPKKADSARASVRWNSPRKAGQIVSILNPDAEGKLLKGNQAVAPPRVFKVYLSLVNSNGQVTESYVVDYRE